MKAGRLDEILKEADEREVGEMIAVGTRPEDWRMYEESAKGHPGKIHYTVGMHPCYVEEDFEDGLLEVMPYFMEGALPVALGEIGLDYYHLPEDEDKATQVKGWQREAFQRQLEMAVQLEGPVVIHSRGAFEDCVAMLDNSGVEPRKVVFHCFNLGAEAMQVLKSKGYRASFTGIVTYKKAEEVRAALKVAGVDDLILETDAPYLSPVPFRGKENKPGYLAEIGTYCADFFEVSRSELKAKTTANARAFFGL